MHLHKPIIITLLSDAAHNKQYILETCVDIATAATQHSRWNQSTGCVEWQSKTVRQKWSIRPARFVFTLTFVFGNYVILYTKSVNRQFILPYDIKPPAVLSDNQRLIGDRRPVVRRPVVRRRNVTAPNSHGADLSCAQWSAPSCPRRIACAEISCTDYKDIFDLLTL